MLKKQTQQLPPLLAGRGVEVIVSDGGSTDATIDLARHLGKVVSAPRGRSRQMNAGARAAHGDVLLFMHADTTLPPEALDEVRKALGRPGVVGGCFTKAVSRSHWLLTLADLATNLRFRLRLSLYGDRAVFVRRGVFDAVGGYNEALDILEDVDLGLRLKRRGRLVQVPARRDLGYPQPLHQANHQRLLLGSGQSW